MTTSREEIAKLCDALPCGWKTQTCDASPKSPPCLKCRARRAILSQQRSLDRVAALCDEAATITTGRTEMQMWGVVEVRRLVGVLGNIRAALESQPSPEVSES